LRQLAPFFDSAEDVEEGAAINQMAALGEQIGGFACGSRKSQEGGFIT